MEKQELSPAIKKAIDHLHNPVLPKLLKVQGEIIKAIHEFMETKNVTPVMPLMTSPITDPLNHSVTEADFTYAGQKFSLMKSMILHKQLLLTNPQLESIYIVSPNVRLEGKERFSTGRHLFEFTQIDFEFKNKDMNFVILFVEEMVSHVFTKLNTKVGDIIKELRGDLLKVPGTGWPRFSTHELIAKYGEHWEKQSSLDATGPYWVTDHEREFYDKEEENNSFHYNNYDIMWPEGFGEGLSGAERENEYNQILMRMERSKANPESFKQYLEIAKAGLLAKTAGAGIGIERLTRFVTKREDVNEICPFSRKPFDSIPF